MMGVLHEMLLDNQLGSENGWPRFLRFLSRAPINKVSHLLFMVALLIFSQISVGAVLHIDEKQDRINLQDSLE